jgi:hypothetical protein
MLGLLHRNGKRADEVHRVLRYLYPSFDQTLKNYPNIEDFLNFLEMAKQPDKTLPRDRTEPSDKLAAGNFSLCFR